MRAAVVLLTLTALAAAPAAAQESTPTAGEEVRARERALVDAMHRRDRAALEDLLAADFVMRGAPDIDRETWIGNAVSLCWGDRSDIEAFNARSVDGVVIATLELTFYADPTTCQPAVLRSLITDVWTRQADGWRLQVRHSGPAPSGVAAQFGAVPLPEPDWDLNAELSLVSTAGNTDTRTLGLGGSVLRRGSRSTTRGTLAFITSQAEGVTQARSLTTQGRHGIQIRERLEIFGRGGYVRDRFAGIDNRVTAEGGLAYTAALSARHELTLDGAAGYTIEDRLDAMDLRFASGTGTIAYLWKIRPGTEFGEDVALTADLETARNWRGTSLTALTVSLTEVLSLKASHAVEYRNEPVAGFGRTDQRTSVAFVFSWQHRPAAP